MDKQDGTPACVARLHQVELRAAAACDRVVLHHPPPVMRPLTCTPAVERITGSYLLNIRFAAFDFQAINLRRVPLQDGTERKKALPVGSASNHSGAGNQPAFSSKCSAKSRFSTISAVMSSSLICFLLGRWYIRSSISSSRIMRSPR